LIARTASRAIDLPTLIAIAAVCNVVNTLIHEGIGHGATAAFFGAHIIHVSNVDLSYDDHALSAIPNRIVAIAGPLANLITGAIVIALSRRWTPANTATRYFLWLFGITNLLSFGGYAMALSFAPYGDINQFVTGLASPLVWKLGLTIIGLAASFLALFAGIRTLGPWIADPTDRRRRMLTLTLVPYLTMGILATSAGALNPDSPMLILVSAGSASFGGNAFIVWMPAWIRRVTIPVTEPIGVARSVPWLITAAFAVLFLYIGLAPGLPR
jgi:hypothetical protein